MQATRVKIELGGTGQGTVLAAERHITLAQGDHYFRDTFCEEAAYSGCDDSIDDSGGHLLHMPVHTQHLRGVPYYYFIPYCKEFHVGVDEGI